jgi:uncharacterized iron-regulated membrane protein
MIDNPKAGDASIVAGLCRERKDTTMWTKGVAGLRRLFFWTHLIFGFLAGAVILVMSATGVLLTYDEQIVAWADRGAEQPSATSHMPVEEILAAYPDATSLTMKADPTEAWVIAQGRSVQRIDPSTGRELGPQQPGVRAFFRTVTNWHRWLGSSVEHRATTRSVTGAANLAFLVLVVSGLYLWFPRKWAWPNLRAVFWFRGGLPGKARDFNWHNVVGFWCCIPLFFIVLSGVVMSYPWANDLVYKANGVEVPVRGIGRDKGKGGPRPQELGSHSATNLNPLVAKAREYDREWRSISFALPAADDAPITFNIDAGTGGQPQKRSTVTLDRATGAVIRCTSFDDQNAGQRARSWFRFVHTGEYYGLAGQAVAGVASAGGTLLVWTGLAMAYRRFRSWSRRR